jgi:hypothetical protein
MHSKVNIQRGTELHRISVVVVVVVVVVVYPPHAYGGDRGYLHGKWRLLQT